MMSASHAPAQLDPNSSNQEEKKERRASESLNDQYNVNDLE